jgi:hypothetical protein
MKMSVVERDDASLDATTSPPAGGETPVVVEVDAALDVGMDMGPPVVGETVRGAVVGATAPVVAPLLVSLLRKSTSPVVPVVETPVVGTPVVGTPVVDGRDTPGNANTETVDVSPPLIAPPAA